MSLTERERQTLEKYDVSVGVWLAHSGGRDRPCFWPEGLSGFLDRLKGEKNVLEIGCGPATDGKYLQKAGATVLSTDYSSAMLDLARELNPGGTFVRMDMKNLALSDNRFDGFWATACLLHLESPDRALRELVRVTKRDGVGFITMKEGDGDSVDPNTGYYFRYYRNPDFIRKLRYIGLETILSERKAGVTTRHDWLTYLVKVVK